MTSDSSILYYVKAFPDARTWIFHGGGARAQSLLVYARQYTDTVCMYSLAHLLALPAMWEREP